MYNFKNFIQKPERYSSIIFFEKEEQTINHFQKLVRYSVDEKNPHLSFESKRKQIFYDKLPYFVDIQTILDNPDITYIVPGGIRQAGSRYPDFCINAKDINLLKYILQKTGIFEIYDWKEANIKIIELIQYSLNTDSFNNIKKSRWSIFDHESDSFRDLCMNTGSYRSYKGKIIPTNISMLLFLFGDCREHNILLLYLTRIYFYYNKMDDIYFVTSIYTSLGVNIGKKNIRFKDTGYEHTFPVVLDKQNQKFISIDALLGRTKLLKYPSDQINLQELIFHKKYIECGYSYTKQYKDQKILFENIYSWFTKQKMEYIESTDNFVYGIRFMRVNKDLWFDKKFHQKIKYNLLNSRLCRK